MGNTTRCCYSTFILPISAQLVITLYIYVFALKIAGGAATIVF